MLRELLHAHNQGRSVAELTALAAELVQENDRLRLEVAKLQRENRNLRRRLHDRELRTLRRAEVDAALMGCLWLAGLPTSRRECEGMGISRRRWAWARALLQVAHIVDGDGWAVDDAAAFDTRLGAGVRLVEAQGMTRLRGYMPRNGTPGRKFGRRPGHANGHATRAKRDHFSGH